MKVSKWLQIIATCLCSCIFSGCAQTNAGFENFKTFNQLKVGRLLSDRSVGGGRKPLAITRLSNGNDEYQYELNGSNVRRPSCVMVYEVSPQTEIVVRSSYIGDEKGCVIVP